MNEECDPRTGLAGLALHLVGIGLHNKGPGIAQDVYVNVHVVDVGGPNGFVRVEQDRGPMWAVSDFARVMWTSTMMSDYRLAPDATVTPMIVTVVLRPPFADTFWVKLSCGANGAVPYRIEWKVPAPELRGRFDGVMATREADFVEACRAFGERLLRV